MKNYNSTFWKNDNYFTTYNVNPYFALYENGAEQTKNKIFGKLQFNYDITKEIKATYRYGGDIEHSTSELWTAKVDIPQSVITSYSIHYTKLYEWC